MALTIGTLASAGIGLYMQWREQKARDKAQQQLEAANTKSTDTIDAATATNRQNLQPYLQLGSGAAGLLGQGLGIPVNLPAVTGGAPGEKSYEPIVPESAPKKRVADALKGKDPAGLQVIQDALKQREAAQGPGNQPTTPAGQRQSSYGGGLMPGSVQMRHPETGQIGPIALNDLQRARDLGYMEVGA